MEAKDELSEANVSVHDIHRCLLSSLDFAEDFAHNQREHAAAVTDFSQDIRMIKRVLMSSFKPDFVPASLHDIICGLIAARVIAEIMRERDPEKSDSLTRFMEGLNHAQAEFIGKVRPQAGNCP
ncbi:MAG TPA: hypothetical protein VLL94_05340 [Nitrospiraceae bacterium]|nr:hypothetical protein [Nitrospiraceae bacterium]